MLDGFLLGCIAFASCCALGDWLLTPIMREHIRQKVGDFWTWLQYSSYRNVRQTSLEKTAAFITRLTGQRLFSLRAFCVNVAVIAFAFFGGVLLDIRVWDAHYVLGEWRVIVIMLLIVAVPSYYTFWFSTTILRLLAERRMSIFALILCCILIAIVLVGDSSFLLRMGMGYYRLAYRVVYGRPLGGTIFQDFEVLSQELGALLLAAQTARGFTAAVWAPWSPFLVLYPFLTLLKVARRLFQPVVTVVLERLYESKQGVLSQVGIGVAAISKLLQEILKHLGYLASR